MTLAVALINAALAVAALAVHRSEGPLQRRLVRAISGLGVAGGLVTVLARGSFGSWRATTMEPGLAAIVGTAIACAWGLTSALALERDRWWVAGCVGAGSASLLLLAGAVWVVPALLFWGCLSAALAVVASREANRTWGWIAVGDAGIAIALVASAIDEASWVFPSEVRPVLLVPVGIAVLARAGVVAGLGTMDVVGTRAAPVMPLVVGSGLVLAVRVLEHPLPAAAAVVLLLAVAGVAKTLARGSLRIRALSSWPAAMGLGLCLAVPATATTAAVSALLGVSAFAAWPDAFDRGGLSRAAVVSMIMPNVMFGAVAAVASAAFVRATAAEGWAARGPWTAVASLLPLTLAVGLALGVSVARTARKGGYHPEAVFMSWLLFAASIGAALLLGAGGVYAALGGGSAVWLVVVALCAGVLVAWRSRPSGERRAEPLAQVDVGPSWAFPGPVRIVPGIVQGLAGAAVVWLTFEGLQTGFL